MTGTFTWQKLSQQDLCPFYQARASGTGITVQNSAGVETFMSRDGSMVRLVITGQEDRCNSTVYTTNYPSLFLTEDQDNNWLQRPLPPSEASPFTFATQQDRSLYGYLTSFVRDEVISLQEHLCKQQQLQHATNYRARIAEQSSTIDGQITALGNGHFLTISGEILHRFRCRSIVVQPRQTEKCYSSMPVTLSTEDAQRFIYNTGGAPDQEFFIQPRSRILTTHGLELPCRALLWSSLSSVDRGLVTIVPRTHVHR